MPQCQSPLRRINLNPRARVSGVGASEDCWLHQQHQSLCLNLAQLAAKHKNTFSLRKSILPWTRGKRVDGKELFLHFFAQQNPKFVLILTPESPKHYTGPQQDSRPRNKGHIMESTPVKHRGVTNQDSTGKWGQGQGLAGLVWNGQTAQ